MARGGWRPNSGRKKNQISPGEINNIRARIQCGAIIKRLQSHIEGKLELQPSAVTAALGLLRKVLPDLAAVEHSDLVEHKPVERMNDAELTFHIAQLAAAINRPGITYAPTNGGEAPSDQEEPDRIQ